MYIDLPGCRTGLLLWNFCKSLKSCKRRHHQGAEKGMTKRGGAWGKTEIPDWPYEQKAGFKPANTGWKTAKVMPHYINLWYHNPSNCTTFEDDSVLIDNVTFKNPSVERVANTFRLGSFTLVISASSFLLKHLMDLHSSWLLWSGDFNLFMLMRNFSISSSPPVTITREESNDF